MNSSRDLSVVRTSTSDEYVCFMLFLSLSPSLQEGEKKFRAFSLCVRVLCECVFFFLFSTRKAENLIVALPVRVQ